MQPVLKAQRKRIRLLPPQLFQGFFSGSRQQIFLSKLQLPIKCNKTVDFFSNNKKLEFCYPSKRASNRVRKFSTWNRFYPSPSPTPSPATTWLLFGRLKIGPIVNSRKRRRHRSCSASSPASGSGLQVTERGQCFLTN